MYVSLWTAYIWKLNLLRIYFFDGMAAAELQVST